MPSNKSGRFWKSERDRFRSVIKTKGLKQSLKQKTRLKEEKTKAKLYEQSLKLRTQKEKEELRARQEENKKKREANQKKSEVVQEVKLKIISRSDYVLRYIVILSVSISVGVLKNYVDKTR